MEQSLALLRRAAELGYFANAESRKTMLQDVDLDPLRERTEFQAWIATFERDQPISP